MNLRGKVFIQVPAHHTLFGNLRYQRREGSCQSHFGEITDFDLEISQQSYPSFVPAS